MFVYWSVENTEKYGYTLPVALMCLLLVLISSKFAQQHQSIWLSLPNGYKQTKHLQKFMVGECHMSVFNVCIYVYIRRTVNTCMQYVYVCMYIYIYNCIYIYTCVWRKTC